jgi:hypothetical protein
MPSKRSEDALIARQRLAESYGYQFEFRGQTEGFATIKMSLNTDKGVINLCIRDSHFKVKRPEDATYIRWPLTEFEGTLDDIFSTYKITERDQTQERSGRNIKKEVS